MKWKDAFKHSILKIVLSIIPSILWYWRIWNIRRQIIFDLYCPNPCNFHIGTLIPNSGVCCPGVLYLVWEIAYIAWPALLTYVIYSLIQKFK